MEDNKNDLSSLRINRTQDSSNHGKNKKLYVALGIAGTAVIITALYFLLLPVFHSAVEVNLVAATVQSPAQSNAVLTANGYVVAQRKAAVASKGTGRLVYLGVVEGDKVKKGEIIARLEDNDVRAQLAEAKANLEIQLSGLNEAKNNYEREKALYKTGSTTEATLDAAAANYKRTEASIDLAKAQVQAAEVALENTVIRAPFDGTVLTKNADVGEIVAPLAAGVNSRAAVVTIADMRSLQVEADVSESNIERIVQGQDCEITLDAYPSHSYPGYVAKIVPTADRAKATVMVKVGFKNYDNRVLPEMSAKVLFLAKNDKMMMKDERPALVVPNSALTVRNGRQVVFKVKNNEAVEVSVITGRRFGSFIEIKSGLQNGEKVIQNITQNIKDGTKVKVG